MTASCTAASLSGPLLRCDSNTCWHAHFCLRRGVIQWRHVCFTVLSGEKSYGIDDCSTCCMQVPYLKRVAIAHKLHHSEKFDGVPWGLFLGPMVHFLSACKAPRLSAACAMYNLHADSGVGVIISCVRCMIRMLLQRTRK
jgi:hypothetical protein